MRVILTLGSGAAEAAGVHHVNSLVLRGLQAHGDTVSVQVFKGSMPTVIASLCQSAGRCWKLGRRGLKAGKWYSPWLQFRIRRSLRRWVGQWQPDAVLVDGLGVLFLWLPLIRTMRSCRFLCILHNTVSLSRHRRGMEAALQFANVEFVAVSQSTAASFIVQGMPPERIHAIPNGFDFDSMRGRLLGREAARAALGVLDLAGPVFGVVGRLAAVKQPQLVLAAFRSYVEQGGCGNLVFVGDGELADGVAAQAAAWGLSGRVHLTGWVKDAADYLRAFDIYVTAALKEGLSIALFEAIAAGLPIICSDIPSFREVLPARAITFDPGEPEGLVAAMLAWSGEPGGVVDYSQEEARFGLAAFDQAYLELLAGTGCPSLSG